MFTARPAADNRSPVVLNAPERSCIIAPPARPARSGEAATSSRPDYEFCARVAQPDARHARPVNTPASALANLVLREDLLGPLNRLFQSNLRRDPVFDNLGPGVREDMLVLHLRVGWVVGPEIRDCRAEQPLLRVSRPVGVLNPPGVVLHD